LPRLVITPGEPAGIGPDICIKLVQYKIPASIIFIADPGVIEQRAEQLQLDIEIVYLGPDDAIPVHQAGLFPLLPISTATKVTAGKLSATNVAYVLQTLDYAIDLVTGNRADALVTCPVHKGIINDAGIQFTGHTEWLAQKTKSNRPVMMLAIDQLRVALVTTHLPLSRVSDAITTGRLESAIRTLHHDLISKFHLLQPRIRICGLNPHAGENGHLGSEESEIIEPVIKQLVTEGMDLTGPVPADTAFIPESLNETDAILAMYHDQGLPVLKYAGFEHAVNITLGLPIIRTSVDHGTALELSGTGTANAASLFAAVTMAAKMISPVS
jgi:4-hydroxythreonine-4-phosphate dehydrogenase